MRIRAASTMLVVEDLQLSKQFYVEVLGLELQAEYDNRMYFNIGGHPVVMFQGDGKAIASKHAYDANSTLVFTVDNLDESIAHLRNNGVVFVHEAPFNQVWGRYAAFKDPSGIVHEVYEASRAR